MLLSRQRGVSARQVLGVAVSVGLHLGVPCVATRWVDPSAAPWHRDLQLLEATLALEPTSGDAMLRSDARAPRELAARPPSAPSARRERHRAQVMARPVVSEAAPASEPPSDEATPTVSARSASLRAQVSRRGSAARDWPSQAPADARGPGPSSASGSTPGQSNPVAPVLARYLRSARERVMRHRQYPHLARRARLEGTVCVRVSIAASGQVRAASVTCGGSQELLVRAALQSVEAAAPFAPLPAELGRELTIEVPVVFELTM